MPPNPHTDRKVTPGESLRRRGFSGKTPDDVGKSPSSRSA
jgi:hypothetical protein